MSQQRGLRILGAVDGSMHSEAAVKLTAGITWPAGTIAHVLAVVPERWWLSEISQATQKVLVETLEALRRADWKAAAWFAGQDSDSLRVHGLEAGYCAYPNKRALCAYRQTSPLT